MHDRLSAYDCPGGSADSHRQPLRTRFARCGASRPVARAAHQHHAIPRESQSALPWHIVCNLAIIVYNMPHSREAVLETLHDQRSGHDRIYRMLLGEIVEGALAPGTRLVESRLAERLGVSRT